MKSEINRYFDNIISCRSDEEFLSGALGKADTNMKKRSNKKKIMAVPIAAAVTIAVCGIGVGAAYGFEHLTKLFGGNENIVSEIQSNVFSDSDGHVSITVEQLVSDGRHIHAAVHYKALDDTGRDWLADEPFGTGLNSSHDILNIMCKNNSESAVNAYGSHELDELRTQTDRFFYLITDINDVLWHSDDLSSYIRYPMTDGARNAAVDVEKTIESRRFSIVGNERSSKYLTPVFIEISPLSYALYAHDDHGLVTIEHHKTGGYRASSTLSFEEYNAEVLSKQVYLVFSDGERIQLPHGYGGYSEEYYIWQSGEIFDVSEYDTANNFHTQIGHDYSVTFNYDDLVGIEIGDVYYDLIAE